LRNQLCRLDPNGHGNPFFPCASGQLEDFRREGDLSVRLVVQHPAAEYADERCDDEKVEQREIFQNGRHGLLLLISSG